MEESPPSHSGRPGSILWLVKWLLVAALAVAVLMLLLGDDAPSAAHLSAAMATDTGIESMPRRDASCPTAMT